MGVSKSCGTGLQAIITAAVVRTQFSENHCNQDTKSYNWFPSELPYKGSNSDPLFLASHAPVCSDSVDNVNTMVIIINGIGALYPNTYLNSLYNEPR